MSVYDTGHHACEYAEDNKKLQNLIVRSGKSEGEVTNNRRQHSRYRTVGANYRQMKHCRPLCDR